MQDMAPCSPCFPQSSVPRINQPSLHIGIEIDGFILFKPIAADNIPNEYIASNTMSDQCNNASVATNGDDHGVGAVHMYRDPSAEDDDDGSVSCRLLGEIGKSMSSPSLLNTAFNCCKEVVRETSSQRSFRLRNMNLKQCTEMLGSESYSSAEASADHNSSNAAVNERCPLCGIIYTLEEYRPRKEREAKLCVPTIFCRLHGLNYNAHHPFLSSNSMKRSKSTSPFPPPLSSSVYDTTAMSRKGSGNHRVQLQRVSHDGRLLLKVAKSPLPPCPHLRATRGGGRLTLFLSNLPDLTCSDDGDAARDHYNVPCEDEASHQNEYSSNHSCSNVCPVAIVTDIGAAICMEGGKPSCESHTSVTLEEKSLIFGTDHPEVVEEAVLTQRASATFEFSSVTPIFHLSCSNIPRHELQPTDYLHKLQLQTASVAELAVNSDVAMRISITSPGSAGKFIAVNEFRDGDGPPFSQHQSTDVSTGRHDLHKTPLTASSSEWLHCKNLRHLHSNELDKIKMHCVATR